MTNLLWAVLIAFLEGQDILPEYLFAFFAGKYQLISFLEVVVLHLVVTVGTLEPLFAAGRSDSGLDVENVFAHQFNLNVKEYRLFQIRSLYRSRRRPFIFNNSVMKSFEEEQASFAKTEPQAVKG